MPLCSVGFWALCLGNVAPFLGGTLPLLKEPLPALTVFDNPGPESVPVSLTANTDWVAWTPTSGGKYQYLNATCSGLRLMITLFCLRIRSIWESTLSGSTYRPTIDRVIGQIPSPSSIVAVPVTTA